MSFFSFLMGIIIALDFALHFLALPVFIGWVVRTLHRAKPQWFFKMKSTALYYWYLLKGAFAFRRMGII